MAPLTVILLQCIHLKAGFYSRRWLMWSKFLTIIGVIIFIVI